MADTSITTTPFAQLWAAWPREGRSALAMRLGGSVAAALADTAEPCAEDDSLVRLSAALRGAGHPVLATSAYIPCESSRVGGQRGAAPPPPHRLGPPPTPTPQRARL